MNKKLSLTIVAASMTCSVAVLNMRFNTQIENSSISLNKIEALAGEPWEEDDEIDLHGSVVYIPVRSIASKPFQAIKYSSHITVSYLINLNNITVQIVNASGQTVYSNTVNPVAGGQLYISLASLSSGDYTISFTSANGGSMYGDFEI
jgi:hypothetical protein